MKLFVDFTVKKYICIGIDFLKSPVTSIRMQLVLCWFLDLPYGKRM